MRNLVWTAPLFATLGIAAACGQSDQYTDAIGAGDAGGGVSPASTAQGDAGASASKSDAGADAGSGLTCPGATKYKRAYFGDLHTHTIFSADAWAMGTLNEPADAYAFARGASKTIAQGASTVGPSATIDRPLDFDAVTDHSEWLAVTYGCVSDAQGKPLDPSSPFTQCKVFTDSQGTGPGGAAAGDAFEKLHCQPGGTEESGDCTPLTKSAWQIEQDAANTANDPCNFTAFVAYEWTGTDPDTGGMLHKNVIFANEHVPDQPYDFNDYDVPTKLWTALDTGCTAANNCTAITIPHNSNKSNGSAFVIPDTADGVRQMNQYQRLVEVYQHKGSSECAPVDPNDSTADQACNFEQLIVDDGGVTPQSFIRTGLENGLSYYADGGAASDAGNPLTLGFVGATDDHNGLPGNVLEGKPDAGPNGGWPGHIGSLDDSPDARLTNNPDFSPGAITGVWAQENTRAQIYQALYNRETFATSGPRIQIRFYEIWDDTNYCNGSFPGGLIDAGGIPMGSNMPSKAKSGSSVTAPWFYVSALKDQDPLAHLDIVKGWVDGSGQHESRKGYDAPATDFTCVRWQDPNYDPTVPAFYYARVLQTQTPRWSHYDCLNSPGTKGCGPGGNLDIPIQERAWTSPIWALP